MLPSLTVSREMESEFTSRSTEHKKTLTETLDNARHYCAINKLAIPFLGEKLEQGAQQSVLHLHKYMLLPNNKRQLNRNVRMAARCFRIPYREYFIDLSCGRGTLVKAAKLISRVLQPFTNPIVVLKNLGLTLALAGESASVISHQIPKDVVTVLRARGESFPFL
jgi:hypothetical protein